MSPTTNPEQSMAALEKANRTRTARAALRHKIATGEVFAASIVLDPPEELRTMSIAQLVMAQPWIGKTKMRRLLGRLAVPPLKPVGELTEPQRERIAKALGNGAQR